MSVRVLCWLGLLLVGPVCLGRAGTLAQFHTAFGDIEVELYDQDKPVTVGNFVRYVRTGAYTNMFAHRLVPGFVLQGGGFSMTNRGTSNPQPVSVATFPPITNEFAVGRKFSNVYGTIAMAKLAGDTNSASSQWFFNLANNTFLDAADTNNLFVVFGHVVRGTNVLNVFNKFQTYTGTQTTNVVFHQVYAPPFDDLPLLHPDTYDTDFVYMDISLLQVAVKPAVGGGHQISWNSPAGMTNVVEFTTNLPSVWYELMHTNGTGGQISVVDTSTGPRRSYRVRVPY